MSARHQSTTARGAGSGQSRKPGRPPAGESPVDDAELLELALRSFAERGFEGTSVRDLCRQLGVSHNLIHQRFGSKDDLWYAAVDHGFETLTYQMMEAVLAVGDGDDLDRLRAVLVRFVEMTAASPALVQVINQEGVRPGPRLDHIYKRHIGPALRLVQDMLNRLAANGRVRNVSLTVFYFLMANGATGPLTLPALAARLPDAPASKRKVDLRRYAESVVDIIFDGIVIN
ncbi:MAG: TetR/AcrR family transcriptional regulator [Acidimicrobiales bacterium]|nr:TetR/AcrR family transcriptional regulator [Acidimicrobiales bacterium]